jgi:hypothetical protein
MKQSYAELCDAFTKAPVLAHFDPAKPICQETDTLGFAITGIILQQQDKVCGNAEGAAQKAISLLGRATGTWLFFRPGACHQRSKTTP